MSFSSSPSPQMVTALGAAVTATVLLLLVRKIESSAVSASSINDEGKTYLLAGDIGGTNARFSLYEAGAKSAQDVLETKEYQNSAYITDSSKTFENEIIAPFLNHCKEKLNLHNFGDGIVACLACAGPVQHNRVVMTNIGGQHPPDSDAPHLEVVVDGAAIEKTIPDVIGCKIVNDFVGQGYGSLDLDLKTEVIELIPGSIDRVDKLGPRVCVGAGTGLGECFLTKSSLYPKGGYECYPSEGGHSEFSPRNDLEIELLQFLKNKFIQKHRVSVERVVSGKGLANIYEFLSQKFPERVDEKVHKEFLNASDLQGRVIGTNAKDGNLCDQALKIFAGAYGCEVGSASLKFIPTGGMYVSGGLTPKNIGYIQGEESEFMKAFWDKGRVKGILKDIPLFAVMQQDLGLRGAYVCALREYKGMKA
eukprot:CAMPEP_0197827062 /NCGR_PEP_ID=MMETSP1437-20131217/3933_1 /TAXON_ID=49252 ORGANISM="Eucampia antarctica, Strain CCMP1452" /NCGR_SAMPLE_ID=MMETSP1437 /ASSEMBLY_ACC=CAM_ASM_001096 /LENGTH=419 /DNA_ID=CAMNT_0043427777 /DNA_START=140 /DNA_END=1399 /DNA_ORIENTATION=+